MPSTHISYALHSYDTLAHLDIHIDKVALVTEGGGQRGIFTAGVLDAFLEQSFNPFSLMIGTSAGSLNLASYICGQHRHAYRVITEATVSPEFFDTYKFLLKKKGLDLDWLLEQTETSLPLNWQLGHDNMKNCKVLACASHATHHEPTYFDLDSHAWQDALKASCAIPFISSKAIQANDEEWLDGSIAAPIPAQEAYNRGYKHIVVIRTVPISTSFDHRWMCKYRKLLGKTKARAMIDLLIKHEAHYRATQDFLSNPPEDATIYEIHPNKALHSTLLGSSKHALEHDYEIGLLSGKYFLATAGRHIEQT
ncbi:patatin family protein [Vibrio sp.]|uniref:patatin family protein n=1 Tax=Vibrio sp. TaxID=678 RepID=UPI00378E7016